MIVRSDEEIDRAVREELDDLFVRLAARWDLKSGDVDPMLTHVWEEQTVPAVIDFVRYWYRGNVPPPEYVTVVLEVPAGKSEGIDVWVSGWLPDGYAVAATYPGDLVTDEERQQREESLGRADASIEQERWRAHDGGQS